MVASRKPNARLTSMNPTPVKLTAIAVMALGTMAITASPPIDSRKFLSGRAEEITRTLKLQVLPKESGYLGIIGTSSQMVDVGGRRLGAQSQNYYMLTRDRPINYLHWLASDDTHILVEGGPVDYYIFHPNGGVEKITLGRDLAAGQRAIVAVPGGCWKALRLRNGADFALMVNVLSPEFTRDDRVKIGANEEWVKRYTNAAPWATDKTLREFIGPNWIR